MMTIEDLVVASCQRGVATGRVDPEAAQNSVNRINARLGVVGRLFDGWYRCGARPRNMGEHAILLVIEAIALAVNLAGIDHVVEVLEARSRQREARHD